MVHCVTLFLFFHVSSDLEHLLATQYFSGRLLPCQGSSDIFVPLLKILDQLLVMGVIQKDKDLRRLLVLLDPELFTPSSTKSKQDAVCNTYWCWVPSFLGLI